MRQPINSLRQPAIQVVAQWCHFMYVVITLQVLYKLCIFIIIVIIIIYLSWSWATC